MSKIKNGGLDQYGSKAFEQQQFGTAGVEGVKQRGGKPQLSGGHSVLTLIRLHVGPEDNIQTDNATDRLLKHLRHLIRTTTAAKSQN